MILVLLGTAWAAKGHLVIVEGDKDPEVAAFEQTMWKAEGWPSHGEWPKLLDSATVPGLKPGFHVLALAFVEHEASALEVAAYVNELGGAAYVREVELDLPHHHVVKIETPGPWSVTVDCPTRQTVLALGPATAEGKVVQPIASYGNCPAQVDPTCSGPGAIYLDNGPWGAETSEDWAWFSNDVATAAKKAGLHVDNRAQWVLDRCDGTRVKIEKQETVGYWVVKPGAEPLWIQHDMTDSVLSQASAYLGLELSLE